MRRVAIMMTATLLTGLLAACSGQSAAPASTGPSATGPSATGPSVTTPAVTGAAAGYGTGQCGPAGGATTPVLNSPDAFTDCPDPGRTYSATVKTSEGTAVLQLDTERTPITANNVVNLARSGYLDDTALFRTEAQTGIQVAEPARPPFSTEGGHWSHVGDGGAELLSALPGRLAAHPEQPRSRSRVHDSR